MGTRGSSKAADRDDAATLRKQVTALRKRTQDLETERERLGATIAAYQALVGRITEGSIVLVGDVITEGNPVAVEMLACHFGNTPLAEVLDKTSTSRLNKAIAESRSGKDPGPVEVRTRDKKTKLEAIVQHPAPRNDHPLHLLLRETKVSAEVLQERQRVAMADKVNQVLRAEIQQHRRTQEDLRRSKQFARSLVDSSLDMIMAADTEGRITEYNPAACLRFGWELDEVLGKGTDMLYAIPEEYAKIQKELDEHGVYAGEITNITKYGEHFTSFLAASRLYDEAGAYLGAMGVSRDITRMKAQQEALRTSEERYRDLFENATDLIQSVDAEGRFEYTNTAWRRALGYSESETAALRLTDILHPDHSEAYLRWFAQAMKGEPVERITTVFVGRTGAPIIVEGTISVRNEAGMPIAARSIFSDVSGVHAARERLQQQEAKLRALFETGEHMFWTVDPKFKLTSYNTGYANMVERLYGNRPEVNTDPDRPRKLFAPPDYHQFWETKYAEAFRGLPVRFETELRAKDGERVCNEIFLSPVFGSDGRTKEVFGIGHEITEQKEAEDLVKEQAARLEAIFQNAANVMIWTLDSSFRLTSYNAHFRETIEQEMGLAFTMGDDFVGTMRDRLTEGPEGSTVPRYLAALKGKPQQFETQLSGRNGRSVWVEVFLNPIKSNGQVTEISCMAYGTTDRKEAEMQLMQSLNEKEVLLKEVHHRVKNNLQVISSILSLQTAHVGDDKRILDLLRDSRDRIRSMSFIHESLYQNKDFSSIDLASYIEGLSRNLMMSYSLSGKIALHTDLQRTDLVLDQAIPCGLILNEIIGNALKHAFPDQREGEIHISLKEEGGKVAIRVSDNGIGLPKGFDPKEHGNLGMELVETLVDQLDGSIGREAAQGVSYLLTFDRHQ